MAREQIFNEEAALKGQGERQGTEAGAAGAESFLFSVALGME